MQKKKTNKQTKTKNPAELDQIVYLKDVFAAAKCFHDENNDFYDEKYW